MGKKSKLTTCATCGHEIAANVKKCPNCGAKNKKSIPKWAIVLLAFFLFTGLVSSCESDEDTAQTEVQQEAQQEQPQEETEKIPSPEGVELKTPFEQAVWEVVYDYNAKLWSIESVEVENTEDNDTTVTAAIGIENDEAVVNAILEDIAQIVTGNDTKESIIIVFGDIDDGKDGEALLMGAVYSDGKIETAMESSRYNTAYNKWVNSQFSAWDGHHYELERIICKNLNDEDSYEHIETTYISVSDENKADINKILSDAGYTNRVEVGDLLITTQFSAKNAFNATIKATAIGISSYSENMIYLVDME